jgi:hypothetical protein
MQRGQVNFGSDHRKKVHRHRQIQIVENKTPSIVGAIVGFAGKKFGGNIKIRTR